MKTKIPPTDPAVFIKDAVDLKAEELEAVVRQRLINAVDNSLNEMVTQEKTKAFMAEVDEIKNKFGVNMNSAIITFVIYKLAELERKLEQIESKK